VDTLSVLLVVLTAAALAGLVVVSVRYVRLRGEVEAVLERVATSRGPGGTRRSLYRTIRELEKQLELTREQAYLLRTAVDRSDLGIVIADRAQSLVFSNPAADAVMKGRQGDTVARGRVMQLIERITFTGVGETMELDLYTPVRRILNLTGVPLPDERGKVRAAVVFILDFTDRHRVEVMRRDFVANAGHELKTPLGAMALLAETLIEAEDEATRIRLAQRVQSEAARMARVVDDVLVLAETESLGAEQVPLSMADVITEAIESVSDRAEEKKIELVRGHIEEVTVAGDHQQLLAATQNLLNNAITYTAVKGEPGTVWYRLLRAGGSACLEVQDTGIGIPERYIERVFERFFCVDRAQSRQAGGTGLGLSIVRNVAIAHGGNVAVRSEVGVGSTFTLCLPVITEESS
jgi:two-component system sensor histidine kinase SenX3